MSNHTPGPWDAYHVGDKGLWCIAKEENGVVVDPSQDNASLIAAAPEMYEALVYARNVLPNDKWADDARGIIVAAIAKAEGR